MHKFLIDDDLEKKLAKIKKKDKVLFEATMKKIIEIVSCHDLNHYKNLRKPLQEFKRVHVKSSFVLIFTYDFEEKRIVFYQLKHHDEIYSV